jgi:hypothetical protein
MKAERRWNVSLILAAALPLISIFSLWTRSDLAVTVAGTLSLVIPFAYTLIRESAIRVAVRADKCRRVILLADSLGREIPRWELVEMTAVGLDQEIGSGPHLNPYYVSRYSVGPQRLADNVAESAFYTRELAERFRKLLRLTAGVAAFLALIALWLADLLETMSSETIVAAAKTVAVMAIFFIFGDFAILAARFGDLADTAKRTFDACVQLRDEPNVSPERVRDVTEDYGIGLVQCPPIPNWWYVRYRDRLNSLYSNSHRAS